MKIGDIVLIDHAYAVRFGAIIRFITTEELSGTDRKAVVCIEGPDKKAILYTSSILLLVEWPADGFIEDTTPTNDVVSLLRRSEDLGRAKVNAGMILKGEDPLEIPF